MINHGIAENVIKSMIDMSDAFFNLTEKEKKEFQGTGKMLDPISCGTNFTDTAVNDKILCWRDFFRVIAHPQFNSPYKPDGFRYI